MFAAGLIFTVCRHTETNLLRLTKSRRAGSGKGWAGYAMRVHLYQTPLQSTSCKARISYHIWYQNIHWNVGFKVNRSNF